MAKLFENGSVFDYLFSKTSCLVGRIKKTSKKGRFSFSRHAKMRTFAPSSSLLHARLTACKVNPPPKKTPTKKAAAPKVAKKITKSPAAKAAKKVKVAKEDKPKRAPGPYMLFCKAERPKIVAANPKFTFGEVGKELGAKWRGMTDAQKLKFK